MRTFYSLTSKKDRNVCLKEEEGGRGTEPASGLFHPSSARRGHSTHKAVRLSHKSRFLLLGAGHGGQAPRQARLSVRLNPITPQLTCPQKAHPEITLTKLPATGLISESRLCPLRAGGKALWVCRELSPGSLTWVSQESRKDRPSSQIHCLWQDGR